MVVVTGADVVVVVESVADDADAADEEGDDEEDVDDEDFDDEVGDPATLVLEVVDVVAGAAEWAVLSVAIRTPSPAAARAAAAATTPVARRTLATARSRDRAAGGVAPGGRE